MPDGSLASLTGKSYDGSVLFNGHPKIFVAGSTGELGRRVVLDLLKTGHSLYLGARDEGRIREVQYMDRYTDKYQTKVIKDAFIEGGRKKILEKQLEDASVVIDCAGARYGFDVFRPGTGLDQNEPTVTDKNGTIALVDAAVAKGVKKFIYVSAVMTNAQALGETVLNSEPYKGWNGFGNVLQCKHEAEEYIKNSGLDYTILRPVPMSNDFPRDVGGIWFGKPDTLLLQDGEVGKQISRDDVSLAILDAVYNEKASRGIFELTGVRGSPPTPREEWWNAHESGKAEIKPSSWPSFR